jgi:hypothetical protein
MLNPIGIRMDNSKAYQLTYKISDSGIGFRISSHLRATHTLEQIKQLLDSNKVKNNQLLRVFVSSAYYTAQLMDTAEISKQFSITKRIKQNIKWLGYTIGMAQLPFTRLDNEINRALYLEYFKNDYTKSQKIYRSYVGHYLKAYKQDKKGAEDQFCTEKGLKNSGNRWTNTSSGLLSPMADAIALLTTSNVHSSSYSLLQELAKLGHGIAILRLNTREDQQAPDIIMQLVDENEYALGKLHHEFMNGERWATEYFCWHQDDSGKFNITNKREAHASASFMNAVEAYNRLAFDQFYKQQSKPEIIERLDIIRQIMELDLDIKLPKEAFTGGDGDKISAIPYQPDYTFEAILPQLEKRAFEKISQALLLHSEWKRAKMLLGECYKLALGTEQSVIKAFGQFLAVSEMDYHNSKPINSVDSCYFDNSKEVVASLKPFIHAIHKPHLLPQVKVDKQDVGSGIELYPQPSTVFISDQPWLIKHFMPVAKIDLGLLKKEWHGITLPICLAYEPDEIAIYTIGEKTSAHHNDYLGNGWYSFKLNTDNQYEFLGKESYFYFTNHEDTDRIIEHRHDIQLRQQLYCEQNELFKTRYRNQQDTFEPVEDYIELGGEPPYLFTIVPPSFYCSVDKIMITIEDKPMYHITTINKEVFSKYYQVGNISIFFEPDSRTVLYSCKHINVI